MHLQRITFSLNTLALALITLVLGGAFGEQLIFGELPCPLCLLQRAGLITVGLGFLLNLRFGIKPLHYGVTLLGAIIGAATSTRQILLHIAPDDPGYSEAIFGFHLYTWSFLSFVGVIFGVAVLLCLSEKGQSTHPAFPRRMTGFVMLSFLAIVFGNLVSTLLECGLTQCPDDPIHYLWLDSLSHLIKSS